MRCFEREKNMKLLSVLKTRRYGTIAVIAAVAMALIYPYTQVLLNGGLYNYFFWFEVILSESILNFILYLAFSFLFGVVVALNIHNWKSRACSMKGSVGSGGFGSMLAIFTSQCSACISIAGLFLPIAAVGALTLFNTLLIFSIHLVLE